MARRYHFAKICYRRDDDLTIVSFLSVVFTFVISAYELGDVVPKQEAEGGLSTDFFNYDQYKFSGNVGSR